MAAEITRTVADDAADAAAALADAEREIVNLRAHLARVAADPTAGNVHAARRCAGKVSGEAALVFSYLNGALLRAGAEGQLSAVS